MSDLSDHSPSDDTTMCSGRHHLQQPSSAPDKKLFSGSAAAARKRVIDETQLAPEEAERLEKKRAYNRESATRVRMRNKHLVEHLQEEVATLSKDKKELMRVNQEMRAKMALLEKHNQTLLLKQLVQSEQRQRTTDSVAAALYPGGGHHFPSSNARLSPGAAGGNANISTMMLAGLLGGSDNLFY